MYSCNGSADEIEKNYGLFPDSCVVLLSRTLRIRTADSRNILHVLTVFPTFILPDFYFTIPIKKCYTAVCGKRYLCAAVSFFRREYLKPRNFTEVNCMDSCDSTGRSTKCGVAYRETQDAAIGAVTGYRCSDRKSPVAGFHIEMSREHRKGTACPSQRCMVGPRQE